MPRYGAHGRVLIADLTTRTTRVEEIPESVYRQFLGGYGLGAYLMWKHYPPRVDALAPEACFAIVSGLLTGARTPFSGRIQIVGKSPLTGSWADSNSGGSVASQLRRAGYDALVVRGRASEPSVLVVRDGDVRIEPAGELWGQEIPPVFDRLRERYGARSEVGVSAIGPAGEGLARIAPVEAVFGNVIFITVTLILNLLVLPLYLVLIWIPPLNLVLFYLLNGYLLGREYFEMVAVRRLELPAAKRLRRDSRGRVIMAGAVITFLLTIPLVNLITPIIAMAFMLHVFEDLRRRAP